ncbi:MAG: hypothetical protein GZ094_00660 [Mariniphaga sp.]|nr:hypothetical protein [Mariniphaga sp.]
MKRDFYLIIFIFSFLSGCSYFSKSSQGDGIVAKVGDKFLLRRELAGALPGGTTKADSVNQAKDYIQRWVKQELMLLMAEENLSDDQKDVQRELDEYRTSLIIHRYQQQLISQKLDTVLTASDIRQFYDLHPERFILEQHIVKAIYIEVPKNVAKVDQLKRWMNSLDDKSRTELEKYSFQYATKFDYFDEQWIDFSQIRSRMPVSLTNADDALNRKGFIETYEGNKYYLAAIKDYRLKGDKAPFEFVKDGIANLILNNRKMELIDELQKNIYQKGKKENLFKITD